MDSLMLRERLSDVQHQIWSKWMKYLFSLSTLADDGSMIIPKEKVDRWTRQLNTDYADLSEKEKDSDRHQADKVLAVFTFETVDADPQVRLQMHHDYYVLRWSNGQLTEADLPEFAVAIQREIKGLVNPL